MSEITPAGADGYSGIHGDIVALLEATWRAAARSVNALMTASYWEIGRRIVKFEQSGQERAAYGQALLKRLSIDLSGRFGRGFSERNLEQMRLFYLVPGLAWPGLATGTHFADTACEIGGSPDSADTVCKVP